MAKVSFARFLNVNHPVLTRWSSCSSMMREKDELKASECSREEVEGESALQP
jgi:hypothetical protein